MLALLAAPAVTVTSSTVSLPGGYSTLITRCVLAKVFLRSMRWMLRLEFHEGVALGMLTPTCECSEQAASRKSCLRSCRLAHQAV